MIIWPVLVLEEWSITRPMARMVLPTPGDRSLLPDVPNWTWHEYGMRVGFWRLQRLLKELGVSPTVTANAAVCDTHPAVVTACLEAGWELTAHSVEQVPMHLVDDERATIEESLSRIEAFAGHRPRGWFGPGLTETLTTIDHLVDAGVEYIGDWAVDDEPVRLRAERGSLVALPYSFELHDVVVAAIQHQPPSELMRRVNDAFECLYREGAEATKVLAIALHPYVSGAAHRLRYVDELLRSVLSRPGVVAWDGGAILDWFTDHREVQVSETSVY